MSFDLEAEVYRALEPAAESPSRTCGAWTWTATCFWSTGLAGSLGSIRRLTRPNSSARGAGLHGTSGNLAPGNGTGRSAPASAQSEPSKRNQLDQVAGIRKVFEEQDAAEPIDALARFSLEFLESKVPEYDGEPVLVQGDTGPGNFMYKDGRSPRSSTGSSPTIGDPMDDIAWLSWRATQHSFPDFPARLREYEALIGIEVDDDRVRYYRVNACARLGPRFGWADMGEAAGRRRARQAAGAPPAESDRTADGSGLIMSMLHRRMVLTALAEAIRPGPSRARRRRGGNAQGAQCLLRHDPRASCRSWSRESRSPRCATMAKGIARQVKYLKEIDRNGAFFDQQELAEWPAPRRASPNRRAGPAPPRRGCSRGTGAHR